MTPADLLAAVRAAFPGCEYSAGAYDFSDDVDGFVVIRHASRWWVATVDTGRRAMLDLDAGHPAYEHAGPGFRFWRSPDGGLPALVAAYARRDALLVERLERAATIARLVLAASTASLPWRVDSPPDGTPNLRLEVGGVTVLVEEDGGGWWWTAHRGAELLRCGSTNLLETVDDIAGRWIAGGAE